MAKVDYSLLKRDELKALLKKKMAEGTDGDDDWNKILDIVAKKDAAEPTKAKKARVEAEVKQEVKKEAPKAETPTRKKIKETQVEIDKNYAEVDKNLKIMKDRREAGFGKGPSNTPSPAKNDLPTQLEKADEQDQARRSAKTAKTPASKATTEVKQTNARESKAQVARKEATAKAETKAAAPKPKRAPKVPANKPAIEALDDLPNPFTAGPGQNPKIAELQRLGLIPEEADALTGQVPQAPPVQAPTPQAPQAPAGASRFARAKAGLGKGKAFLGALGKGALKATGVAGTALGVREMAYAAFPEAAQAMEDAVIRDPRQWQPGVPSAPGGSYRAPSTPAMAAMAPRPNPTIGPARPQPPVPQPQGSGINGPQGQYAFMPQGMGEMIKGGVTAAMNPTDTLRSFMQGRPQQAPQMAMPDAMPSAPPSPFAPKRPTFADAASAKLENVKAREVMAPQQTAVQKIAQAKSRPAKSLLKSSPARVQAQSMMSGLPKTLQDQFNPQSVAGSVPEQSAPFAHEAPVDFGQSFADSFGGAGLTSERLPWLESRESGLGVQEQLPSKKRNPLLRALGALRRPF